jgi:ribosomal protein L37AE/L43A
MSSQPSREHLPGPVMKHEPPADAFNPLLRSLLTWGLVERLVDEEGDIRWELTAAAQERLESLNPRARRAARSLAYLDHWCARCRQQRLTHLREGRYLCQECEQIEAAGGAPLPEPQPGSPASELAALAQRVRRATRD